MSCAEAHRPGLVALLAHSRPRPQEDQGAARELKIESLADLTRRRESGKIAKLKGFGEKTEAKILEGIAFVETAGERILQSHALRLVGSDPRGGAPSTRG